MFTADYIGLSSEYHGISIIKQNSCTIFQFKNSILIYDNMESSTSTICITNIFIYCSLWQYTIHTVIDGIFYKFTFINIIKKESRNFLSPFSAGTSIVVKL